MNAAASGGAAAAAAAAEEARRREEEEMTGYSPEELDDDWEFKFLRSSTGTFKRRDRLEAALESEAQAGWQLVEKFDNNRLRLKRRILWREKDHLLSFDAYRTQVGLTDGGVVAVVFGVIFAIAAVVAGVLMAVLG